MIFEAKEIREPSEHPLAKLICETEPGVMYADFADGNVLGVLRKIPGDECYQLFLYKAVAEDRIAVFSASDVEHGLCSRWEADLNGDFFIWERSGPVEEE